MLSKNDMAAKVVDVFTDAMRAESEKIGVLSARSARGAVVAPRHIPPAAFDDIHDLYSHPET